MVFFALRLVFTFVRNCLFCLIEDDCHPERRAQLPGEDQETMGEKDSVGCPLWADGPHLWLSRTAHHSHQGRRSNPFQPFVMCCHDRVSQTPDFSGDSCSNWRYRRLTCHSTSCPCGPICRPCHTLRPQQQPGGFHAGLHGPKFIPSPV